MHQSRDQLPSALEQQLIDRFTKHSSEISTFLQYRGQGLGHPTSTLTKDMAGNVSTLVLEMDSGFNFKELCSRYELSEEEFFLSAYILTLRRYTGQDSLSFCIPMDTNILPIAIQPSMDLDLPGFFTFVKTELNFFKNFKTYDFQSLFAKLNETSDHDLVDVLPYYTHMFTYNNQCTEAEGTQNSNKLSSPFSLKVTANANVQVSLTWEKSMLETQFAHFFVSNYINCCHILADPAKILPSSLILKQLDILCEDEKNLLASFQINNSTNPTLVPGKNNDPTSIISLFDQNYRLNPEKVAINENSAQYTYAQLWEASHKIAGGLQAQFTPQQLSTSPIVLLMEKNFECIASVLGVWRAAGHFLPIDANLQENLTRLLASKSISPLCILTNLENHQLVFNNTQGEAITQVKDFLSTTTTTTQNSQLQVQTTPPTSSAYITMTSGSTGKPKKCTLSHAGLLQFISSAKKEFDLCSTTNILQWVSFSFDVFISDLVKGLICTNGCLTLVSSLDRFNVSKIATLVSQFGVNFIQMTPQFALFACQEIGESLMAGVTTLVLGGESLTWKTLQLLKQHLNPATKIYNCYGLTETTIESTAFLIPNEAEEIQNYTRQCRYVPIGRPLQGIPVQILDPVTLLPTPIGCCGTLTISGATVGSGDFLPLAENEPTFMTGDRGSWLPNGVIQFQERDSSQILKASGLRINTAELENKVMDASSTLGLPVDLAVALTIGIDEDNQVLAVVLKTSSPELLLSEEIQVLQDELKKHLPYYMVPQFLLPLSKFPTTQNGKIDRRGLEIEATSGYTRLHSKSSTSVHDDEEMTPTENYLLQKLISISGSQSTFPFNLKTKREATFRDVGFTSFQLMKFANVLLKEKVSNFEGIVDIFTHPTIKLLAEKIDSATNTGQPNIQIPREIQNSSILESDPDPICIVGLSFRLPGNPSGSIPDFWATLSAGTCFVRDIPEVRAQDVLTRMTTPFTSSSVRASFFESIDQFDHEFFHIAPSEAKHMCPEQRFFLEIASEALVDAGYNLSRVDGANIGVYATASEVEYGIIDPSLEGVAVVGRQSSVVPSRLSYTYNLRGGNYVVDTACSAALTALEQAVRDLRVGSCEAAVVGGVNIYLYPAKDGLMGTNLIHSPNSTCLPFDDRADGTASGEGAFAYVLKRASAARKSGDYVYSTIESVTSNAVGRGNGITAPSVDSQVKVIQAAINQAGITIDDLDFLETHGTGTILGDQIELCALNTVFAERTTPTRLTLGATKQQFGHLDMSAAFLGLLKATCALTFNFCPKMGHIQKPSKYLDQSVFQTGNSQLVDWSGKTDKAYAGISAYGLSGTNCHSVISVQKQNPSKSPSSEGDETCKFLLPVQERRVTFQSMCGIYSRYAQFYLDNPKSNAIPGITLPDLCGTQVMNLINQCTDPTKIQEVAILSATSFQELIKKLDAIEQGIRVLSTSQIEKLDSSGLMEHLPKASSWTRVPALPKFFYQKFSHWLNPVVQQKPQHHQTMTDNNAQLVSLQLQLAKKSAEIHALVGAAHKLERMLHQFTIGLLTDLPISSNNLQSKSSDIANVSDDEDNFIEAGYSSMSPSPTPSSSEEKEVEEWSPISPQEDLTYATVLHKVRDVWQDCLGCDEIEGSSIFRELGGDSLLTVQMSKVISKVFGIRIKAADAFSNPTLSSFASLVFCTTMDSLSSSTTKDGGLFPLNSPRFEGMPLKMILFPGQGSQKVEMFQSLSNCPAAAPIFEEAKQITGIDLLALSNNPESFQNTEFVQVALFVGSLAKIAQLRAENPEALQNIRAVGGLSVGEFAALVFAEAIEFKDALRIVQYRGKVMQQEVEATSTGMISIFGPEAETFTTWLDNNQDFSGMEFCTYLASNQFTIGGPLETCQSLVELLTKDEKLAGQLGIIDARLLKVAGAFHTKYMKTAGNRTATMIDALNISFPKLGVVMNFDGQIAMNKESIRFNLKKQTSCPVMWKESMMTAYQMGIRKFTEISPSSVLTPILKNRIKGISNVETTLIRF